MRLTRFSAVPALFALLASCGGPQAPSVVRLVDEFDPGAVEGAPSDEAPAPLALWNFAEPGDSNTPSTDPLLGWKAGIGVADLRVIDGKLTGRAVTDFPILYAPRPDAVDTADLFHSLVVRGQTSAEAEIRATLSDSEKPDFEALTEDTEQFDWRMEGRFNGGDSAQTVTLSMSRVQSLGSAQNILLRPAAAVGQTFSIESIQLVSQREHRASIASGVGWQGLGEIFRETIVSRSPETFTVDVDIPSNAWLDLHVGTVEETPVTFRITDESGAEPRTLLERTLSTPHRWERAAVELRGWEGARKLRFSLDVEGDRRIGFWGGPAIRVHGAQPPTPQDPSAALGGASAPQGVLLIMADTLRSDHLNAYGYERETAPHLARMAGNGALFLDNISQASWTKVSTPSILTSLYPQSHRVKSIPDRLPAAAVTLAEVYRDAGYVTASFCSNAFTGRLTNLHQGFEEVHEAGSFDTGGDSGNYSTKTSRPIIDRLTQWLEDHRDTPYFAYVHLYDPHSRFEPRAPYNTLWNDPAHEDEHEKQRKEALATAKDKDLSRMFGSLAHPIDFIEAGFDPAKWIEYETDWYDASIRGMDAEIGRLLERLRSLALEDRTLIGFVADHGEELHDHGKMGHGYQVYGEVANVPLLLYRPGVIPSLRIGATTRSIDLAPTLLASSGLSIPEDVQGQNLLPLIAGYADGGSLEEALGAGWETRPAVSEEHKRKDDDPLDDESYAIVLDGWKLIHNTRTESKAEYELFHHAEDPLDAENLADQHPDKVEALLAELKTWRQMVDEAMLPAGDSTEGMSSEELEKLRNLGYIQ